MYYERITDYVGAHDARRPGGRKTLVWGRELWLGDWAAKFLHWWRFLILGSLLVWGHRAGWTIPKFSSLTGHADDEQSGWCSEHNVLESQVCGVQPDLLPKPKCLGWCKQQRSPRSRFVTGNGRG